MQEVSIYITTTAKGPAKRKKAYYIYTVEYIKGNGNPETRGSIGSIEDVTENQVELIALIKAFERLIKPCSVRVFTRCEHILNSCNNGWPWQWEKNGWKKAADKQVKNADLWQQLLNVMRQHTVTFSGQAHGYEAWQGRELEKAKEQDNG